MSAASPPSGAGSRAARVKLALAAAALVGALLFLLVPLTRVLALDFTALLRNLTLGHYESYPIKESWFAWGDAALRLGALPWALIMAAAVLLRLQARWIPGSFSLAGASPRLRLALAAAALVPLLAFALPFGLALCTWTMVETHWWIQWYGNREPALWLILYDALPVFVAGLILAGLWTTALALRGAAPRRSGWRRWGQAALVGLAALVSAPVLLATASPLALHGSRLLGSLNSVALFEKKCSGCHDVTRPLYAVNTPDQWEKLVRRIKKHEVLALTAAEDQNLAGFLRGMRSFSDSWTFRARCQRCHVTSYLSWDKRHPEDWEMIVDRVAQASPHYYPPAVKLQVSRHLKSSLGDAQHAPGISVEKYRLVRRVVRACSRCHYISRDVKRQRQRSPEAMRALIRRMSRRMRRPIPPKEIEAFADTYRVIIDPANLPWLVPHHRPRLKGILPW